MRVWTSARIKSNKQSDIIARYNLEFHNKLRNCVQRFYAPAGMVGKEEVSLMPNVIFMQVEGESLAEIGELFDLWMTLDSNIFYPNIVKDEETDKSRVEVIPEEEMATFMNGVSRYFTDRDSLDMNIGDTVEIISGYFRGRRGTLMEIHKEQVVVMMSIMTTAVPTTVLKSCVQVVG